MAPRRNSADAISQLLFKRKDIPYPARVYDYPYIDKVQMLYDANQKELRKQLHSITAKAKNYTVTGTQTDSYLELDDVSDMPEDIEAVRECYARLTSMNRRLNERNKKLEEKYRTLEEDVRTQNQTNIEKLRREGEKELKLAATQYREQIRQLEEEHKVELRKKELLLKNSQIQIQKLEEEKYDYEKSVRKIRGDVLKLETENRILRDENKTLERDIQMARTELDDRCMESAYIESLTKKCVENEQEKRIILENFRKLERERDQLMKIINDNIESVRKANAGKTERLLERITNVENRLDIYELS